MDTSWLIDIPEGRSGDWTVERFTVSKEAARLERMRAAFHGDGRVVPEGTYTALKHRGATVMSTTPDELRDLRGIYTARGHVLIAGLGLGCAATFALARPDVTKVTVVEISADVIRLVAPHIEHVHGDRIEVIQADIFAWTPPKGARYGFIWHDVWDSICGDNKSEMTKLKRRFGSRADRQACWCEALCR